MIIGKAIAITLEEEIVPLVNCTHTLLYIYKETFEL